MHPDDAASLLRPWHDGRRDLIDEAWNSFLGLIARIANRAQSDPDAQPRH